MPSARFTVLCDECIRIEWSETGRFVDEASLFASARSLERAEPVIADAGRGAAPVTIHTSRAQLTFRPDGRALHAGNLSAQVRLAGHDGRTRFSFWHPGDVSERNLGGTLETLDGMRGPAPIGQGLLSRDGWHVIDDSRGTLLVDGWANSRAWRGVPESNTDWYLFVYGDDYASALRALARVAGPVNVPRRYAMGSWYSRYWPHSSAEYRGIVADYHQHGFPLDVMVLDMDWHSASARGEWTGWSWNRELLPDAEGLVEWLHTQGLAVTLNLHPADGVGPREERYAAFMRAQGADPATGERLGFDAGNRAYMAALFGEVLGPMEGEESSKAAKQQGGECESSKSAKQQNSKFEEGECGPGLGRARGVDFWWVDWQQDRQVPSVPGLTNLAWLNHQFFEHTSRGGKRGLSFSRWAGVESGDHRHPVHFSGDAHTGWEMLAFQVPFTAAAGNAGCFFWSHDIGGHFGPRIEECTARWVWFGALSAALRLHSARSGALDRRPWASAEPFAGAMRRAFALRSELMPYIDGAAHECEERALPLLRPMYLLGAAGEGAEREYRAPGQYMLGGDLLVAPVVTKGLGAQHVSATRVWFPRVCGSGEAADGWFNWFTHERYAPGAEAMVAAGIDEVPLFASAGVPIPTRTFSHRPATEPVDGLVVRLWPGSAGTQHVRALHEDDGETVGYRRGEKRLTPIAAEWMEAGEGDVRLRLIVGPGEGTFAGAIAKRAITLALGGATAVHSVLIDGQSAQAVFDEHEGVWRVRTSDMRAERRVVIEAIVDVRSAAEQSGHDRAVRQKRLAMLGEVEKTAAGLEGVRLAAEHAVGAWAENDTAAGVGRADAVRIADPFGRIDDGVVNVEIVDRAGPAGAREHVRSVTVVEINGEAGQSMMLPREILAEPPIGLRASRIARLRFSIDGARHVHEVVAETRVRALTGFVAVGPFPWDWRVPIHEQEFGPERGGFDPGERFSGTMGTAVGWQRAQGGDKWAVDLRSTIAGPRGLGYAALRLVSARAQRSMLHLDSGDKVEAWLNGRKVFSQDGFDSPAAASGCVMTDLPSGPSLLLIKTNDGGGGWGFTATIEGSGEVAAESPDSPGAGASW